MSTPVDKLNRSTVLASRVVQVFRRRMQLAQERLAARLKDATERQAGAVAALNPWQIGSQWADYAADFSQRAILFWDTLRQRGNAYVEHTQAGLPPVLHFATEPVLDGRQLERPVNYALLRIVPPQGVTVDPTRRPYVIIDPRAGHGPGIGGFKDDSQVGVALRDGHPVYFVVFYPEPEPGQTLLDVCAAEAQFVKRVRELHPASPKPAIVGNCQGGWAAMMLAAANPDDTGPIVINGAPMSYWGGAWSEGEGDNPMRYAGGLLGGTWLASLTSDMADGKFDGAWLVQNFENLNPANTYWDKYYHLFANVDTEPPRFLEFERWWGGFYLMNREEIEWITRNLFVGNRLWSGAVPTGAGKRFDLREIRSPIVLFASMGDNITPPQQAFNWVADVYGSTEEIKARGQVIVGLLHADIGHLGIFVSGKVAKKEHAQIVSVLKSIEALPPGLYGMQISEEQRSDGTTGYSVQFVEQRLEDITARLNRFERNDEKPFEAVAAISDFNQRAYELFAQPLVQAAATEAGAQLQRTFHPLRLSRWSMSDLNPWLAWLAPAADKVRSERRAVPADQPLRQAERAVSDWTSASLDYYRDLRDAISEALFFETYGNLFSFYLADRADTQAEHAGDAGPAPSQLIIEKALASIEDGGYAAALARTACLLARQGAPLPLERVALRKQLFEEYRDLMPPLPPDALRRERGTQEIIVRQDPERALAALPKLLASNEDRTRFAALLDRLLHDERIAADSPTAEQLAMLARILAVLGLSDTPPQLPRTTRSNASRRNAR
jgi:pimeloyl-ACP methyl ester carboxylesterase